MNECKQQQPAYLKYFLYLAVVFAACTYIHDLLKALVSSAFIDFAHFYVFAKIMHTGYDVWTETPALMEKIGVVVRDSGIARIPTNLYQSAGFLFLVSPFTLLPFKWAVVSWVLTCQAAFAVSAFLLIRMFKDLNVWRVVPGLFLVFSFWPLREDLYVGQPNLFIVFFITLALVCFKNKEAFCGGLFLGLAVQVKEIFIPILALLLIKKYYKAFAGAFCALAVTKLIYISMFGIHNEISYWMKIIHSQGLMNLAVHDPYCFSIFSILAKAAGPSAGTVAQVITAVFNGALLTAAWRLLRQKSRQAQEFSFLEIAYALVFCLLVSPWVHETHLAVLVLGIVICWMHLSAHFQRTNFILFIISYLLLGLKYSVMILPAGKTLGVIVFFYLLARIIHEKNRAGNTALL